MAEYIDREILSDALYDADAITFTGMKILDNFPVADVVPVKHGRWINTMPIVEYKSCCQVKCSICESIEAYGNFCRNCGARMDGGT